MDFRCFQLEQPRKKNEKKIEKENIRGENETKCVTRPSGSTASPKKMNAKKKYVMEKKRD